MNALMVNECLIEFCLIFPLVRKLVFREYDINSFFFCYVSMQCLPIRNIHELQTNLGAVILLCKTSFIILSAQSWELRQQACYLVNTVSIAGIQRDIQVF